MNLKSSVLLVGFIAIGAAFIGCGESGPEAIPSSPVVESGKIVKVEGLEPVPKKKGLAEAPQEAQPIPR